MSKNYNVSSYMVEEKIGYDWANKKMIIKIYDYLNFGMNNFIKPNWTMIVKSMLFNEGRLNEVNPNGYYSTIRTILKDIKVIKYNGRVLVKGENWDRFYSDENWDWFKTSTTCGGYGEIIK